MKSSHSVTVVVALAFACTFRLRSPSSPSALLSNITNGCVDLVVQFGLASKVGRYQPNWASLDKRPLPAWYDQSKVGTAMLVARDRLNATRGEDDRFRVSDVTHVVRHFHSLGCVLCAFLWLPFFLVRVIALDSGYYRL